LYEVGMGGFAGSRRWSRMGLLVLLVHRKDTKMKPTLWAMNEVKASMEGPRPIVVKTYQEQARDWSGRLLEGTVTVQVIGTAVRE
jgi:hypothetical protein